MLLRYLSSLGFQFCFDWDIVSRCLKDIAHTLWIYVHSINTSLKHLAHTMDRLITKDVLDAPFMPQVHSYLRLWTLIDWLVQTNDWPNKLIGQNNWLAR